MPPKKSSAQKASPSKTTSGDKTPVRKGGKADAQNPPAPAKPVSVLAISPEPQAPSLGRATKLDRPNGIVFADRWGFLPGAVITDHKKILLAAVDFRIDHGRLPTAQDGNKDAPGQHDWGKLEAQVKEATGKGIKASLEGARESMAQRLHTEVRSEGDPTDDSKEGAEKKTKRNVDVDKAALDEAIYLHVFHTKRPPTQLDGLIRYGKLKGQLQWSSIDPKLRNRKIKGYEHLKSLSAVKDNMGLISEVRTERNVAIQQIAAVDVFNALVGLIAATSAVPDLESRIPLIGTLTPRKVTIAFQRSAVTGIENLGDRLKLNGHPPTCLQEFMIVAGFIKPDDQGKLVLASPQPAAILA